MVCKCCGASIDKSDRFCPICGRPQFSSVPDADEDGFLPDGTVMRMMPADQTGTMRDKVCASDGSNLNTNKGLPEHKEPAASDRAGKGSADPTGLTGFSQKIYGIFKTKKDIYRKWILRIVIVAVLAFAAGMLLQSCIDRKKTSPLSQSAYAQKNASAQAGENAAAKPKNAGFADSGSISRKMDTSENEEEMSAAGSEDLAAM